MKQRDKVWRMRWILSQKKHAKRIEHTLEHLKTSNTHELNRHKINIKYWFRYYTEEKSNVSVNDPYIKMWSKLKNNEHIITNAESFIYRVVNNYL